MQLCTVLTGQAAPAHGRLPVSRGRVWPQCRMAIGTVLRPRTAPHRTAPHRPAPPRTAPHRPAPHRPAPHRTAPPRTWLLTLFSHSVCSAEHTKYCTSAMCACRFIPAEITCATPPPYRTIEPCCCCAAAVLCHMDCHYSYRAAAAVRPIEPEPEPDFVKPRLQPTDSLTD